MNTDQIQDDKESINQFLHLGRLMFKLRAQHPSMSEADILSMSRLMTTVASGTLAQAVSQQGQRLVEKLSVESNTNRAGSKPGRKIKLAKMTTEERQTRIMKALAGSDGMLAGEIAKVIGLRGAQGLSPSLTSMGKAGLIRAKSGKKGEKVWVAIPKKGSSLNGKANGMNGSHHPNPAFAN